LNNSDSQIDFKVFMEVCIDLRRYTQWLCR